MRKEYDLEKLKRRSEKPKVIKAAAKTPISIRLDAIVLSELRTEAEKLGIPYQTFISSILHQYVNGSLIEKKSKPPKDAA